MPRIVKSFYIRLISGPYDAVEEVEYEFYDRITLIGAGENTSQITCSHWSRAKS